METITNKETKTSNYLWRYTSLSSALDIFRSMALTLLPPESWEDKNDVHFLCKYKEKRKLKSLYAICFSSVPQTFHHWYVFAQGPEGVCIRFNRKKLLQVFDRTPEIAHGKVEYYPADKAKKEVNIQSLPYIKHARYSDEGEYRALVPSKSEIRLPPKVSITPDMISRITLSPWLHSSLEDTLKRTIQSINGMGKVNVKKSTLIEYQEWRRIADQCPS